MTDGDACPNPKGEAREPTGSGVTLAERFAFMFALVVLGLLARRGGALTGPRNERLGQLAFYVLLPALVFSSTHDRDLEALLSVELVVGLVAVIASLLALAWVANRHGADDRRSVALVQSYHGNLGYFGVPVVAATLGASAAATASVVLGVAALVQIPITILVLVTINDADAAVAGELRSVATNPILLTLAASLAVASLDVTVPTTVDAGLASLSALALPVALVAVGGSLRATGYGGSVGRTGRVVALKVLVMPVLAWLVFTTLAVDPVVRDTVVVMFGAPTAVSTYVYATELGGDATFASLNVFATTLAALGTLFVFLRFLA
ncbi:AEC family transporter [Halorubellus sp. PRR65]|uniref:AEC family transporter n=1 Tax=Halorubellus sp. PRR65 TaxID=3098148 RepID=UPI002B263341|nr:AEC family transporter [Halorubellus sp. PRR65]